MKKLMSKASSISNSNLSMERSSIAPSGAGKQQDDNPFAIAKGEEHKRVDIVVEDSPARTDHVNIV